jgi:hypothetical protein
MIAKVLDATAPTTTSPNHQLPDAPASPTTAAPARVGTAAACSTAHRAPDSAALVRPIASATQPGGGKTSLDLAATTSSLRGPTPDGTASAQARI